VPKTISEHCELVKLCYINLSGPVFFRYTVFLIVARSVREKMSTFTSFLFIMLDKTDRLGIDVAAESKKSRVLINVCKPLLPLAKTRLLKILKNVHKNLHVYKD